VKETPVRIYWRETDAGLDPDGQSEAARVLLLEALTRDYGWQGSVELSAKGQGKKPSLKGSKLEISISHTTGMVACAVCGLPIGLDVQAERPIREGLPRRVMSPQEMSGYDRRSATFFRLWTRKEAALKQMGLGLAGDMRSIIFDPYTYDCLSHPQLSFYYTAPGRVHLAACAPAGSVFSVFGV